MADNITSYKGFRIKKSMDNPSRFWIVDESTNRLVETLEDSTLDDAKAWVDKRMPSAPVLEADPTAQEVEAIEPASSIAVDFEAQLPHKVSEVICVRCGARWIAVRPASTLLKTLECKTDGAGFVIETGEENGFE